MQKAKDPSYIVAFRQPGFPQARNNTLFGRERNCDHALREEILPVVGLCGEHCVPLSYYVLVLGVTRSLVNKPLTSHLNFWRREALTLGETHRACVAMA